VCQSGAHTVVQQPAQVPPHAKCSSRDRMAVWARTREVALPVWSPAGNVPRDLQRVWREDAVEGCADADLVVRVT
jgi:hypothetical protein